MGAPIMGVYAIRHRPTGAVYVGRSINIQRRWSGHRIRFSNSRMRADRRLDGLEAFSFEVLEEVTTAAELPAAEWRWIEYFGKRQCVFSLYNQERSRFVQYMPFDDEGWRMFGLCAWPRDEARLWVYEVQPPRTRPAGEKRGRKKGGA